MTFLSRSIALFVASLVASAATVTSAESLRGGDNDNDKWHKKKSVVFSKEKGYKCHGGSAAGSQSEFGNKCEGGMKMEFEMSSKPMDMISNVVGQVHTELTENFIPNVEFLMPSDDVLDDWIMMTAAAAASSEEEEGYVQEQEEFDEGKSMTIEFGGTAKMEWGCKVTHSYKQGKLSKSAECGFKGSSKSGKKDPEQDEDELVEYTSMFM